MSRNLLPAALMALGLAAGCATSAESQRRAGVHQANSDVAASRGEFGVAGSEQRKAEDDHHKAVVKAIQEDRPLPESTHPGDPPPPPAPQR